MQSIFIPIALVLTLSSAVLISGFIASDAFAQVSMHTLTVEVEHESGQNIKVHVGQANEINEFVFTLEQAKDPQFIESQLNDLEPAVLEAVKGALLRIQRSEVLVNSDRVNEIEVEWVTELCNDTNADCDSIIDMTRDDKN